MTFAKSAMTAKELNLSGVLFLSFYLLTTVSALSAFLIGLKASTGGSYSEPATDMHEHVHLADQNDFSGEFMVEFRKFLIKEYSESASESIQFSHVRGMQLRDISKRLRISVFSGLLALLLFGVSTV